MNALHTVFTKSRSVFAMKLELLLAGSRTRIYFFVLAISVSLQVLLLSTFVLEPQLFQDGAINFLRYALTEGFGAILRDDAGYIPLFQRIVTLVIYHLLPLKYYAAGVIWVAIILSAASCACLVLRTWDRLIPSIALRSVIATYIILWPDFQTHLIENVGLYLYIPILTLIFSDFNSKLKNIWFGLLSFVMVVSKPLLIGTLGAALLVLIHKMLKKERQLYRYFIPGAVISGVCFQVMLTSAIRSRSGLWPSPGLKAILIGSLELLVSLPSTLLQPIVGNGPGHLWLDLVIWALIIVFISAIIWKSLPRTESVAFREILFQRLGVFLVSLGGLFILSNIWGAPSGFFDAQLHSMDRYTFVPVSAFLIFVASLQVNFLEARATQLGALPIAILPIVLISLPGTRLTDFDGSRWSDWASFSQHYKSVDSRDFVAPVNTVNPGQYWLLTLGPNYLNASPTYGANPISDKFLERPAKWCLETKNQEKEITINNVFVPIDHFSAKDKKNLYVSLQDELGNKLLMSRIESRNQNYAYFHSKNFLAKRIYVQLGLLQGNIFTAVELNPLFIGFGSVKKCYKEEDSGDQK